MMHEGSEKRIEEELRFPNKLTSVLIRMEEFEPEDRPRDNRGRKEFVWRIMDLET